MLALSWIEGKHKRRHCQWENQFIHIKFIKRKNGWNCRWKKISKAIEENKLTVTIKRRLWGFSLCRKFTCTGKNNDKNKTNVLLLPLLLQFSWLLKAHEFEIFRLLVDYIILHICRRWVEKQYIFFNLIILTSPHSPTHQNSPHSQVPLLPQKRGKILP